MDKEIVFGDYREADFGCCKIKFINTQKYKKY
jgi:hypothetical protein